MENKRIFITGASGTGKSTIAKHMSELYRLEYISTSAKRVWPEFGFKNHKEAHIISSVSQYVGVRYQTAVLNNRADLLHGKKNWVTDRSPIDNIVYSLISIGHSLSTIESGKFIDYAMSILMKGTGLIYLKWNEDIPIESEGYIDGMRINNRYYQKMIDSVISGFINRINFEVYGVKLLTLPDWDIDKRVKLIDEWLNLSH